MSKNGWILLHRNLYNNWVWKDKPFSKGQAWIDILMMVNHSDEKILFNKELVEVKRGQRVTSEVKLSDRWGWSRTKVRNFLETLEKENMIKVDKKNKRRTRLEVCNYNEYQTLEEIKKQQKNNRKTTEKQQKNINNECKRTKKNDKEVKEVKDHSPAEEKPDIPYKKIVDYLNEKAERSFNHKTDNTQKLIRGRFDDGYKIKDFIEVIDKKTQDWLHKNNDKDMSKYLRPDTLFRPANFENYLNEPWPNNNSNNNSQGKRIIDRYEKAVREEEGYINEEAGGS